MLQQSPASVSLAYRCPSTGEAALADDLEGIYFDINEGLFRIPSHAVRIPAHVTWAWTLAFEGDCGRQLASAIRRLDSVLFGGGAQN